MLTLQNSSFHRMRAKKTPLVAATAIALLSAVSAAQAGNCGVNASFVENLICDTPALQAKDAQLAAEYARLVVKHPQTVALRHEIKRWMIDQRDPCRDEMCVDQSYNKILRDLPQLASQALDASGLPDEAKKQYRGANSLTQLSRLPDPTLPPLTDEEKSRNPLTPNSPFKDGNWRVVVY